MLSFFYCCVLRGLRGVGALACAQEVRRERRTPWREYLNYEAEGFGVLTALSVAFTYGIRGERWHSLR